MQSFVKNKEENIRIKCCVVEICFVLLTYPVNNVTTLQIEPATPCGGPNPPGW